MVTACYVRCSSRLHGIVSFAVIYTIGLCVVTACYVRCSSRLHGIVSFAYFCYTIGICVVTACYVTCKYSSRLQSSWCHEPCILLLHYWYVWSQHVTSHKTIFVCPDHLYKLSMSCVYICLAESEELRNHITKSQIDPHPPAINNCHNNFGTYTVYTIFGFTK